MCGFYYVLSGVAFCQLLLNEYCIVLYCTHVIGKITYALWQATPNIISLMFYALTMSSICLPPRMKYAAK